MARCSGTVVPGGLSVSWESRFATWSSFISISAQEKMYWDGVGGKEHHFWALFHRPQHCFKREIERECMCVCVGAHARFTESPSPTTLFSNCRVGRVRSKTWCPHSFKMLWGGTSLVVQWLRLHTSNEGAPGSIPDQGAGSHMLQLRVFHMLQLKKSYMLQLRIPVLQVKILYSTTKTRCSQINK